MTLPCIAVLQQQCMYPGSCHMSRLTYKEDIDHDAVVPARLLTQLLSLGI